MRITQIKTKVLYNKKIAGAYFKTAIYAPQIAKSALPGQFMNIKVNDSDQPLLRRPFSIHRINGSKIELLYEVVGCGTQILSEKKTGDYLDVIGPLGNGFDYGPWVMGGGPWVMGDGLRVLVAGGIGTAPLFFLAERLMKHKAGDTRDTTGDTQRKVTVLIGAKTKSRIICEKEFKKLGCSVKIATDDGSRGLKGKVTELLKKVLPLAISHKPLAIYACGPKPMLKEVARISGQYGIAAQLSLEQHMACGFGACLGCVVNTHNGYKRVCKEGPVFKAEEIIW